MLIKYGAHFINRFLAFLFIPFLFVSFPVSVFALEIIFSSDTEIVQTDEGETFVTFFIKVTNDENCSAPVDASLIFDRSTSMDNDGKNPPQPFTDAKAALNTFLDNMNPARDQVSLTAYNREAMLITPLTKNYDQLRQDLANLEITQSGTNIMDGMLKGRNELASQRVNPEANPVIILFTDGRANTPGSNQEAKAAAIEQAGLAKSSGIQVITIGLGEKADQNTLQEMASPNSFYYAPTVAELAAIYTQIAQDISGGVPDLDVWVDVSSLLEVSEFVSASNGGYLENDKIIWNLGDIPCNAEIDLQYTFKFSGALDETYTDDFVVIGEDEEGNEYESNPVDIIAVGPNLIVTKDDFIDFANNGEITEYEITVTNIGEGHAYDVVAVDQMPEYFSYISSDIPDVQVSGKQLTWPIAFLAAGDSLTYHITGQVSIPEGVPQETLLNVVTITNDLQVVTAEDLTQVFLPNPPAPPPPDVDENVQFNLDNVSIASICESTVITLTNANVGADVEIVKVEYSVDGGKNYYLVSNTQGIGTKSVKIDITTLPLVDKLYGLRLRATTASGNTYESDVLKYLHDCTGRVVILGNYYENGFGEGVLSDRGDLLYNEFLPLSLYAETLGAVESLKVRFADDPEKFEESDVVFEMEYDFSLEIWSIDLTDKEIFDRDVTYVRLEVGKGKNKLIKRIPNVINLDYVDFDKSVRSEEVYNYGLFYYDGITWQELNYNESLNPLEETKAYQMFNLYPGRYYIAIEYPNGAVYYTKKFELTDPTVVRMITTESNGPWGRWVDPYLRHLEIETFSKESDLPIDDERLIPKKEDAGALKLYENVVLGELRGKPKDSQILAVYFNRWNPHFSEQLSIYEDVQDDIKNTEKWYRKVVLLVDEQSEHEVERILKIRDSNLDYIVVTAPKFLNKELRYHPEAVIYNDSLEEMTRIRSTTNYDELYDQLTSYSFF